MELEKNVKHGDLRFPRTDIHNFFNKIHQDNMNGDANDLLQESKKKEPVNVKNNKEEKEKNKFSRK